MADETYATLEELGAAAHLDVAQLAEAQLAGAQLAATPLGVVELEAPAGDLSLVLDVPVEVAVEIGRATMTIRETLAITPGSIVALDRMAGEPVDLLVNGKRIARGEVVAIDEEFGLRVTEVIGDSSH